MECLFSTTPCLGEVFVVALVEHELRVGDAEVILLGLRGSSVEKVGGMLGSS